MVKHNVELNKQSKIETPLQREVAKAFPRLWIGWQKEIAKKYEKFSKKADVKELFAVAKKYDKKNVPQSMIAVSLLNYADNLHGAELSPTNFQTYLQSQWEEFIKIQKLQKEFEAHKTDKEFADYKNFVAKANKKQPVTIEQIKLTKWYSQSAFLFSQYLEKSFAKSDNKEVILWKLSQESKVAFVEYTESNSRLATIVQLPPEFVRSVKWEPTAQETSSNSSADQTQKKSFSEVDAVFARDLSREDGPKKILEQVDQSVFGETRLSESELGSFRAMLKDISLDRWVFFLAQYPDTTPPAWIDAQAMKEYVDTGSVPKNLSKDAFEECFNKIVMAYFVENTKKRIQEIVLKEYFSQVAGLLKVWGNHLHLVENQPIVYETDGVITMKYETTIGLQGSIKIGADGVLSIETPMGYDPQQWKNFNIQPMQKSLDGSLISMVSMMQRGAKNKDVFFEQRKNDLQDVSATGQGNEKNIDTEGSYTSEIIQEMITPEDEIARKNIEEPLKKELLLMQCADRVAALLEYTAKIQWVDPKEDVFLRYLQQTKAGTTNIASLAFSENTALQPLFLLRDKIMWMSAIQAESLLNWLEWLREIYANNSFKKENYPFVLDGMLDAKNSSATTENMNRNSNSTQESTRAPNFIGKKTVRSFLSFFCVGQTSVMKFDSALFQRTIAQMQKGKNDIQMLCELQPTKLGIPLNSLYYRNNPELANQTAELVGATKGQLNELKDEILIPERDMA